MEERVKLSSITLEGFKSFGKKQKIRFGDVTIFIGANGSGKSNVLSFFDMLYHISEERLGYFAQKCGKADGLISNLSEENNISGKLFLESNERLLEYTFILESNVTQELFFKYERFATNKAFSKDENKELVFETNRLESEMGESRRDYDVWPLVQAIKRPVNMIKCFKFQDTSSDSKLRKSSHMNVYPNLEPEGENVAAFLFYLKNHKRFYWHYNRIIEFVKMAYPEFDKFWFPENVAPDDYISLYFLDKTTPPTRKLGAHQLSDGTLRFIALACALLAPPESLASIICLDEPELGLHPTAIQLLAGMITLASEHTQVVMATQSSHLLDSFEPENIRVVERDKDGNSAVIEQDPESLAEWMETYSLGQIWEKNLIGGRP